MIESIGPHGEYLVDGECRPWSSIGSPELKEAKQRVLLERYFRDRTPEQKRADEIEALERRWRICAERAARYFKLGYIRPAELNVLASDEAYRSVERLKAG
jgi:hypothetical protein